MSIKWVRKTDDETRRGAVLRPPHAVNIEDEEFRSAAAAATAANRSFGKSERTTVIKYTEQA